MTFWNKLVVCLALATVSTTACAKVGIVAAENFYGDIAQQVGGDKVAVSSVMANPDQDPHLFEADPSTARLVTTAQVAIINGADYDPWMTTLLSATSSKALVVDAGLLVGKKTGDNPHLWYDPATVAAVADRLSATLGAIDPADKDAFAAGAAGFRASLAPLDAKIAAMRGKYAGVPIAASEPVFGYMAERIGLSVREQRFQIAVMNNAEPSVSDVARFERDLQDHAVKALVVNSQADDPAVRKLVDLAHTAHVPVTAVSELEPAGKTYQTWMMNQLDALDRALSAPPE